MIKLNQNRQVFLMAHLWSLRYGQASRFVHQLDHAQFSTSWRGTAHLLNKPDPVSNLVQSWFASHGLQKLLDIFLSSWHCPFSRFCLTFLTRLFVYGGKVYEGIEYGPSHDRMSKDLQSKTDSNSISYLKNNQILSLSPITAGGLE